MCAHAVLVPFDSITGRRAHLAGESAVDKTGPFTIQASGAIHAIRDLEW
jgi:hypothetical protein